MMDIIENEKWRAIPYLPKINHYEVSDHGRVRYMNDDEEYVEKSYFLQNDYKCISVKGQVYAVHRMMADAFLPDLVGVDKYIVAMKDGNKENLTLENLEKRPTNYNFVNDYKRNGKRDKIYCPELDMYFSSLHSASYKLGVPYEIISYAMQRKKRVFGLTFFLYDYNDPMIKDKKIIHLSMQDVIAIAEKATSIKEFRSQLKQI